MDTNKDKIIVHKIDLGFNVDEELTKELNAKIDGKVLEDAKDIIDELNNDPSVIKKEEENKLAANLEIVCQEIIANKKINKSKILELTSLDNLTSAVGRLRNYASKSHNKKLMKIGKEDYGFEDSLS